MALAASWASIAQAQTASQVVPDYRPVAPMQGGGLSVQEGDGPVALEGAERLKVRVGKVVVEGGLPVMGEETVALVRPLEGRTVTAADLFKTAQALEAIYAAKGYVLVRVVLPAQDIAEGGDLKLVVIDGFIEAVDTSALPPKVRSRIETLLAPLVGVKGLRLPQLERRILLASDTPGTALRSVLKRGSKPGGTVLAVEAQHDEVAVVTALDNSLGRSLGRYSTTLGLDLNSPLGLGEQVYVRLIGDILSGADGISGPLPRNQTIAVGVVVPLGVEGAALGVDGVSVRTSPDHPGSMLGFTSRFQRASMRLRYPAVRSRAFNLNVEGGLDLQDELLRLSSPAPLKVSYDRLTVVRLGADVSWRTPVNGLMVGRAVAGFGLDGLGARMAKDATARLPLSRQGADGQFAKLEVQLGYNQPFARRLALDARFRGQTSFGEPLVRSEQMGLAGPTALSAFDSGLLQGDSAYVLRTELQASYLASLGRATAGVTPYLFGAFGEAWLARPTALEQRVTHAGAYGVGVRLGLASRSLAGGPRLSLEYGRQSRDDHVKAGDRLSFSVSKSF